MRKILIIPDYFTETDSPNVVALQSHLRDMGCDVTIFEAQDTLYKSRSQLENLCESRHFDMIVALETGCLLAGRITDSERVFVNPDWAAWEWMKLKLESMADAPEDVSGMPEFGAPVNRHLDCEEVEKAREMADSRNINTTGQQIFSWFSPDAIDSHVAEMHSKIFNSCCCIPRLALDSEEGMAKLANQIKRYLEIAE